MDKLYTRENPAQRKVYNLKKNNPLVLRLCLFCTFKFQS